MKHFIGGWAAGLILLSFMMIRATMKAGKSNSVDLIPLAIYAVVFGLAAWGLWP